jgi:hypothetical protein
MVLEDLDIEKYKKHPRVLEVRFMLFFDLLEKEYGFQGAMKFVESICRVFNCNITFLNALINRRFDIKRNSKRKWRLWRQEVIFTSYIFGESVYKVARDYLHIQPQTIYKQHELYNINEFCTNEWLELFDNQTLFCGQESYRLEVVRFMAVIEDMTNILTKWKGVE